MAAAVATTRKPATGSGQRRRTAIGSPTAAPDRTAYVAAADLGTTLTGTVFWTVHVALFLLVLRGIVRAPLPRHSRNRWIWLVVLAPGVGIVLWLVLGRSHQRDSQVARSGP